MTTLFGARRAAWIAALVSTAVLAQYEHEATEQQIAEELAFGASVVELDEQNFEHLTQAATGATSGDWLVLFCKESVPRCAKVATNWEKVAKTLASSREAKGLPRINVATVDTGTSSWLRKRFSIQSVPVVHLFKGGVMYSFQGSGFSVDRLVQFAESDFERSSRMLVPPEPHVATPHDQTFLITIGTIAAGAVVLWLVDQGLLSYYVWQKRKARAAAKAEKAKAASAPAVAAPAQ
uniref:Thioredoxin domain-containing protein n=1 Tax=Haptolina brevifila TaxID=156173 RepID=A0A7S2HM62_9EUKA|mmetsp:Transcript_55978/g.111114  ORF Transcript_55978/g.111114 Transcript_55978/m.111114 type:complete len:236 (+) Transcript_55978:86-793(+)